MRINLTKEAFSVRGYRLAEHGKITADAFKYESGVEALRVNTGKAEFVFLPFVGQQIWDFKYDGRRISMTSTVKEPKRVNEYLFNYGGFLYHCGITAFGVPSKEDSHPQHGELPNAEYDSAYMIFGEDEGGKYAVFGGKYVYDKAFITSYSFNPEFKIYENSGLLDYRVALENLKGSPMEYSYLCHINFQPFSGAKLIYAAENGSEKIYYNPLSVKEDLRLPLGEYVEKLKKDITVSDTVCGAGQVYDPELCFSFKYKADESGRGYTLQREYGKGACYVEHPVNDLPFVIRWISSTPDEKALGIALPATGEHLGLAHMRKNGQIKILPPHGKVVFSIKCGYLCEEAAKAAEKKIEKLK